MECGRIIHINKKMSYAVAEQAGTGNAVLLLFQNTGVVVGRDELVHRSVPGALTNLRKGAYVYFNEGHVIDGYIIGGAWELASRYFDWLIGQETRAREYQGLTIYEIADDLMMPSCMTVESGSAYQVPGKLEKSQDPRYFETDPDGPLDVDTWSRFDRVVTGVLVA